MRALRGRIIVKSFASQKEEIEIVGQDGKRLTLWVGKKYAINHREKNPVVCEVLDNNSEYNYIKKGDFLLVHHNFLSEWQTNPFCIEYDPVSEVGLYSLQANHNIFCKINADGIAEPVCGNMLVERQKNPIKSSLIIIPDTVKQEHNDRVKVVSLSPEVAGYKVGQTVLMYKYSDYEICYSWKKKDYSIIKVYEEDLIGVVDN